MPDSPYSIAVNKYKAWLKTPEGRHASPEQQRLKRRSLFTATHKYRDPGEDLLRKREVFINSPQAANIRRLYEFTRRERPDLSAKGAFNVMISQNPSLIKDLTPEQLNFAYSRYVTQDPRRRGTDPGVSNSVYDSNMNPAENPSAFRRAAYSGILNFTTNVGRPVVEGLIFVPDLGVKAIGGASRLVGRGLDRAGYHSAAKYFDDSGRRLVTGTSDLLDYLVPTKTNEADAARGDVNFDWFNRGIRSASGIVGGFLAPGAVSAVNKLGTVGAKASKTAMNMESALREMGHGLTSPSFIKTVTGPIARHPWIGSLNAAGFMYGTLAGAGDERTATDRDLYGFTEEISPSGVRVVYKASAVGPSPDGRTMTSNGAHGTIFEANNQGLNTVIMRLPVDHPLRIASRNAVRAHYVDTLKSMNRGETSVVSNDRNRRLSSVEEILTDDNIPYDGPTSTVNPDNPAPAGTQPKDTPTEEPVPKEKPKVSWYDAIGEEQLWRGGTALGAGLLGTVVGGGGWKSALIGSALGALGYAYGDQLPVWWDKFMKAVEFK